MSPATVCKANGCPLLLMVNVTVSPSVTVSVGFEAAFMVQAVFDEAVTVNERDAEDPKHSRERNNAKQAFILKKKKRRRKKKVCDERQNTNS